MLAKRLIKSNDAGGGACTNTVDLYNPFPDGGGVALYQLNGNATDVSGNYDGTATNVTYGAGVFGQAGVFNGTSSYIDLGGSVISANSSFSISHWVKFDNVAATVGNRSIHIGNSGDPSGISIFVVNSILYLRIVDSTNTLHDITYSPSNNVWYNLVITYDNSTKQFKGYVDNVLIDTKTISAFSPLGNYGAIGSRISSGGANQFLEGSIDQVRIFNRALRPYEVEALYTEEYCTPTIVPSEHFNTVLYTGNEVSGRQITGVGFQPDFVWIKDRGDGTHWHNLFDSVRGASERLFSNTTNAESFYDESLQSFDSDGFTVGLDPDVNRNGGGIVAWNFKAGGAAVTNTDGTITSQVSANTEAGFSVVTYQGNGLSSQTIGHGLGQKPTNYIVKTRSSTSNWKFYNVPTNKKGFLNLSNAFESGTDGGTNGAITTDLVTNTTFGIKSGSSSSNNANNNGTDYLIYAFAEVEGFSNFGSYVGNGSTSGSTVVTGFEPAMVIIKRTDSTGDWRIWDNKRSIENPRNEVLKPNTSEAEETNSPNAVIDFLENGFQPKSTHSSVNTSGASYIYMAFAADPTTIEPTLEDSFNTVLHTPNNTGNDISLTGVNFAPDFVWMKYRYSTPSTGQHYLFNSVTGDSILKSNSTQAEISSGYIKSFDADGVTYLDTLINRTGTDSVVAWCWKGAELPAINSNGSIPSVVSANPAAGFSIVSWTGDGSGLTVGHGLETAPKITIRKKRNNTSGWPFIFDGDIIGDTGLKFMELNTTAAAQTAGQQPHTDTTFGLFPDFDNTLNDTWIAYCFAEVAGFSKFGSYTGNGTASLSNPIIDCGFEPAFVMIKRTDSTASWFMFDNKRNPSNPINKFLQANSSGAEGAGGLSTDYLQFDSNGFRSTSDSPSLNGNGGTYIYMAFANQF